LTHALSVLTKLGFSKSPISHEINKSLFEGIEWTDSIRSGVDL